MYVHYNFYIFLLPGRNIIKVLSCMVIILLSFTGKTWEMREE